MKSCFCSHFSRIEIVFFHHQPRKENPVVKCGLTLSMLVLCAATLLTGRAEGKVAWQPLQAMEMTSDFKDIAITLDGRWNFVLTGKGEVLIYSSSGILEDTITVGEGFDAVSCSVSGDKIYLSNRGQGTLKVLELEFLKQINTKDAPALGPADAPVEIVVFSDFQCPYCASLAPVLHQVVEKYPDKVRVAFKNFPLEMHRMAAPASLAALAAHRQGKFWPYHDRLFENHKQLSEEKLVEIATAIGLDLDKFNADRKSPELQARVMQDLQDGRNADVRGTPAVFVNGKLLRDRSPNGFSEGIDKALQAVETQKKK